MLQILVNTGFHLAINYANMAIKLGLPLPLLKELKSLGRRKQAAIVMSCLGLTIAEFF